MQHGTHIKHRSHQSQPGLTSQLHLQRKTTIPHAPATLFTVTEQLYPAITATCDTHVKKTIQYFSSRFLLSFTGLLCCHCLSRLLGEKRAFDNDDNKASGSCLTASTSPLAQPPWTQNILCTSLPSLHCHQSENCSLGQKIKYSNSVTCAVIDIPVY